MRMKFRSRIGRWLMCAIALFTGGLIVLPSPIVNTTAFGKRAGGQIRSLLIPPHRIGEVPALASQSTYQGPMPSNETITMHLSFQMKDKEGLQQTLKDLYDPSSPNFHHWLTPQEFGQRFGRSQDEIQQTVGWLNSQGMQVKEVWPNLLSITFSGTVDAVQRAFAVTISRYLDETENRTFYANDREPVLPSDFSGITQDLFGLNDAYRHVPGKIKYRPANLKSHKGQTPTFRRLGPAPGAEDEAGDIFMGPTDFANVYDITPLANAGIQGQNQRVGIIIDAAVAQSDADEYRTFFGLPPANLQNINVPDATGKVVKDPGGELEASLDYSMVSAVAPQAEIDMLLVPEGQLTFANTLIAEEYEVNTALIPVVNESFGACESIAFTDTEAGVFDQAATEGLAFCCSSGDSGAICGPDDTRSGESDTAEAGCPACYASVTAVGGTSYTGGVLDSNGNVVGVQDEVIWNNAPGAETNCKGKSTKFGGAGSGGVSTFVAPPDYQTTTAGVPTQTGRMMPDVSLVADPDNLPAAVFLNGNGFLVGGTSMSSPLWAGMMTLINQSRGAQGFPNNELYRLGGIEFNGNGPLMYTDITEGNDSIAPLLPCLPTGVTGFSAGVGFDIASGWGAPDLNILTQNYGVASPPMRQTPPPPPAIQSLSAELTGDTLQLAVVATDADGAITESQANVLDENQAILSQGGSVPMTLRHSTTTGFLVNISGLDGLPTAENVTLVLTDKFGQQSASMTANFGQADPGGPQLTDATLNGKKLLLQGSGFAGQLGLEVNGILVKTKGATSDTTMTFKGSEAALNLRPGPNRIRVQLNGLFSNIFVLNL